MSQRSAPLHIELRPSRLFAGVLLVIHGGAVAIVLAMPSFPLAVHVFLAVLLSVSAYRTISRWALLSAPQAVTALVWDDAGEWLLKLAGGEQVAAQLLPGTFVSPRLVVLNLLSRSPEVGAVRVRKRFPVVVAPDSVDRDTLRRLRVRLRIHGLRETE